jgi:hypothetical protein
MRPVESRRLVTWYPKTLTTSRRAWTPLRTLFAPACQKMISLGDAKSISHHDSPEMRIDTTFQRNIHEKVARRISTYVVL